MIAPRLENADDERIDEINNVYDYALENGLGFYCVTGSSADAIATWSDNTGAEYPFLMADDVPFENDHPLQSGIGLAEERYDLDEVALQRYPTGRRAENDRKRLSGRKYRLESERRCPANNQPIKFYRIFVAGLGIRCLAQSPSPERKRI